MIPHLRHPLRIGALLGAPTAAHAVGIGGSVGLATGYESQGSQFASGGWSGGATLQVDMGRSAWWQTQVGRNSGDAAYLVIVTEEHPNGALLRSEFAAPAAERQGIRPR
jgi:hypothetical protein